MKTLFQALHETERAYFQDMLAKTDGNMTAVSKIAALTLSTAYRRMAQLDIAPPRKFKRVRESHPPDGRVRIETLLPFFGVPCDSKRGAGFWTRHAGQIDAMMFDARKNYMAMVRDAHEAGAHPDAARLSRVNALWQQLVTTMRKHGAEC